MLNFDNGVKDLKATFGAILTPPVVSNIWETLS